MQTQIGDKTNATNIFNICRISTAVAAAAEDDENGEDEDGAVFSALYQQRQQQYWANSVTTLAHVTVWWQWQWGKEGGGGGSQTTGNRRAALYPIGEDYGKGTGSLTVASGYLHYSPSLFLPLPQLPPPTSFPVPAPPSSASVACSHKSDDYFQAATQLVIGILLQIPRGTSDWWLGVSCLLHGQEFAVDTSNMSICSLCIYALIEYTHFSNA